MPIGYFRETNETNFSIWENKGPRIVKTMLNMKNQIGGLTPSDLESSYKAIAIRRVVLA